MNKMPLSGAQEHLSHGSHILETTFNALHMGCLNAATNHNSISAYVLIWKLVCNILLSEKQQNLVKNGLRF